MSVTCRPGELNGQLADGPLRGEHVSPSCTCNVLGAPRDRHCCTARAAALGRGWGRAPFSTKLQCTVSTSRRRFRADDGETRALAQSPRANVACFAPERRVRTSNSFLRSPDRARNGPAPRPPRPPAGERYVTAYLKILLDLSARLDSRAPDE